MALLQLAGLSRSRILIAPMKASYIFYLLLFHFCVFNLSCSNRSQEPIEEPPFGVIFGDSLARGAGVSNEDFSLSSCLQNVTGKKFKNMGRDGETTNEALNRVNDVNKLNPKIVVVSLGGNDILRHLNEVKNSIGGFASFKKITDGEYSEKSTHDNLKQIYESIIGNGSKVIHLGISPPRTLTNFKSLFRDGRLERIALTAAHSGAHFLENSMEGLWLNTKFMSDELHPNDKGNLIVCERLYDYMKSVLK